MNVLLVAPHSDDVEIGCGGTVAKFIEENHNILWVVCTTAKESSTEHKEVIRKIGLDEENCLSLGFKMKQLPEHRREVLDFLINIKFTFKPDLVIGPSLNDCHQDHHVVAKEMMRAFKTTSSIICYEIPSNNIKFDTQLFIRLEKRHVEKKVDMTKKFKSQLALPHRALKLSEEFIRGLMAVRGTQVDVRYAEAFEVLRWML